MIIQGQTGAPMQSFTTGATPPVRLGQLGEVITQNLHGQYYEANYRGTVFATFVNALTLASTHASPIASGTGTPIVSIYNPANSGKNVSLLRLMTQLTSGTPGGPFLWNIIPNPQNITQTGFTVPFNAGNLQQSGSAVRCFNNIALTGSTAGVAYRPAGGPAAVAATGNIMTFLEDYQGLMLVPPGSMVALGCTAAGTTHIMSAVVHWEEIPI